MRPDRPRCTLLSAVFLAAALLWGCGGGDRVSGGTNGTEAGNAVAARIVRTDGSPAAGAVGVFRPADAIDSSTASQWVEAVAGADGTIRARVPDGSWTLDVRDGSSAVRMDFVSRASLEFADTVRKLRDVSGHVAGIVPGSRVYLPGLARSTVVGAGGSFVFRDVPAGATRFRVGDTILLLSDSVTQGLLLSTRWGAFPSGAALAWIPDLSDSNLVAAGAGLAPDPSSYLFDDPSEGSVRGAPLGGLLGTVDPGVLPDTGAFSLAIRARSTIAGVSSLWLLQWTDSLRGAGLELGIGGGWLELRAGSRDTAVEIVDDGSWHWYAIASGSQKLSIYFDGALRLSVAFPSGGSRSSWTRREVGRGGAVQVADFVAWKRVAAVQTLGR